MASKAGFLTLKCAHLDKNYEKNFDEDLNKRFERHISYVMKIQQT